MNLTDLETELDHRDLLRSTGCPARSTHEILHEPQPEKLMAAEHTPTPWCWQGTEFGPYALMGPDTSFVMIPRDEEPLTFHNQEDVPFIIRACNSHDGLVKFLKALQWGGPTGGVCCYCDGIGPEVTKPIKGPGGKWGMGTERFAEAQYGHRKTCPLATALAAAERGTP